MNNLNLSERQRTDALIVAPKGGKAAEVAAYTTNSGDLLISNSTIRPFSPLDGTHLQRLNSNASELSSTYIANHMVKIGRCEACDNDVVATASFADAIEVSSAQIHCPMCASTITPNINNNQLIAALAAEYDDSEDEETPAEDDEGSDDNSEDDVGDGDGDEENYSDDDSDEDNAEDEGDADEGEDSEDDYPDDEESEDYDNDGDDDSSAEGDTDDDSEHADTDSDVDEDNTDEDSDEETASAIASLRAKMSELGMEDDDSDDASVVDDDDYGHDEDSDGGDASDEDSEDDSIPDDTTDEDGGVPYDDVYDDDDVESATAAFEKVIAHRLGERPNAGRGVDRPDIDAMNERARDTVRGRRGNKADGNAYMKGVNAVAAEDQDKTPGTTDVPGEMNKQVVTPGTKEKVPGEMNKQPKTIGTEVSGDLVADWFKDKIELVTASNKDVLWVMANEKPVGKLIKEKASSGVQARWKETSGLQNAFVAVARRGLSSAEASEFGFEAVSFKVEGEQVIRQALQRQAMLATENAKKEVARGIERYKQSFKSALLASFKGLYPDLNNPVREQLVASLSAISVAEPRSIVDTAFAKASDSLLISVFAKTDEWSQKSDDARNEIASYVATANYSARVNEGNALASRLAANNGKVVAGATAAAEAKSETARAGDFSSHLQRALKSIR